jgi:hypothetical protein
VDYKKAWERVKDWVQYALDEGKDRGFDKTIPYGINEKEHAMYEAYNMVMQQMKNQELI